MKLKIYLDSCCFNRPYDSQDALMVRLETEAKLHIQNMVKNGGLELVWSFVLDYENAANPFEERREIIRVWRGLATEIVRLSPEISKIAAENMKLGLRQKDASHLACAIAAKADCFITTDKKILNKAVKGIELLNPIDFLGRYFDV